MLQYLLNCLISLKTSVAKLTISEFLLWLHVFYMQASLRPCCVMLFTHLLCSNWILYRIVSCIIFLFVMQCIEQNIALQEVHFTVQWCWCSYLDTILILPGAVLSLSVVKCVLLKSMQTNRRNFKLDQGPKNRKHGLYVHLHTYLQI